MIVAPLPSAITITITVAVVSAALVLLMIPATVVPALAAAFIEAIAMKFPVMRNVLAVVPVVPHEEDALAAGVILVAVLSPMLGVTGRHAQIDRREIQRYPFDHDGLAVDHLRLRIAADVDASIEARLADADGNADIGREGRRNAGG